MILYIIYFFLTILLLGVFVQDWKFRAIHWGFIPAISICLLALNIQEHSFGEILVFNIIGNQLFITLQLAVGWAYFKIKKKTNLFIDEIIGKGDIYFIYATGLGFLFPEFLLYYTTALLFSLITHLSVQKFIINKSIPLAGYMGIWMILFQAIIKFTNLQIENIISLSSK